MKRSGAAIVAFTLVISACGGSDEGAEPAAEPTPTVEVEPSQTPLPPTPTPDPTPEATAVPRRSEDEQAVIAAWEKYLRLRTEARGKDPSPAAVDYESYVTGPLLEQVRQTDADDETANRYLIGTAESLQPLVQIERDGTFATLVDCVEVHLEARDRSEESTLEKQDELLNTAGRLRLINGVWLVSGQEAGGPCDG